MPTLIYLPYSPWSEKALWALEHHRIGLEKKVHVPLTGELPLRLQAGRLSGHVTVPVLLDGETKLFDSFDIARYADAHGKGQPLFPAQRAESIATWNTRSEAALAAGRKAAFQRALHDPEAQEEGLAPLLPPGLRKPMRFVALGAIAFMRRKYAVDRADQTALVTALDALRAAVAKSPYIFGELTYADIAMAVVLQFVIPVSDQYVPLGPATRRVTADPDLAQKYPDLIAWRDTLYAKHRRS